MKARRIQPGHTYWVDHGGEKLKVVVRCEAHSDAEEWVCEGPDRLFVSLPITAFRRRLGAERRRHVAHALGSVALPSRSMEPSSIATIADCRILIPMAPGRPAQS